ncbi:MAG TPA: class I SAM-dependent methyltransferase [Gammaproteobacteria bacterium]
MAFENTDKAWEKFGKNDPYYGVVTHETFTGNKLDEKQLEDFFNSGREYINNVCSKIKKYLDAEFKPGASLDFGCGVGRLLIPISKISERTVGVDVSESMLKEAKNNLIKFSGSNVELILSNNCDEVITRSFDFIHSFIVFQHIPVQRGFEIYKKLLDSLSSNGVGVLHFTIFNPSLHGLRGLINNYVPFIRMIKNITKGRKFNAPSMQMNEYDVNKLLRVLSQHGIKNLFLEFTEHGRVLGVTIYFKKEVA